MDERAMPVCAAACARVSMGMSTPSRWCAADGALRRLTNSSTRQTASSRITVQQFGPDIGATLTAHSGAERSEGRAVRWSDSDSTRRPPIYFRMLRTRLPPPGFIEPCLPTPADYPPSGPGWIHEIKHDGFRLMARRDAAGVRLLTRNGIDWSARFPLIAKAAGALQVRSFLLDGEAVACDGDGLPIFDKLRYRRADKTVFLYTFDL